MDWKKESNYPAADSPGEVWAWEFLRRNPKYKKDVERIFAKRKKEGCVSVGPLFTRYGINRLSDPDNSKDNPFLTYPRTLDAEESGDFARADDSRELLLKFHAGLNIDMQLEQARKLLSQKQKALKIKRAKKITLDGELLRKYLQVLDADTKGVSTWEIGKALLNGKGRFDKNIQTNLRSALAYRDGKYLSLLSSPPIKAK